MRIVVVIYEVSEFLEIPAQDFFFPLSAYTTSICTMCKPTPQYLPVKSNVQYTYHTVWCLKCWMSGIFDEQLTTSLCSSSLNSVLLHVTLGSWLVHRSVKAVGLFCLLQAKQAQYNGITLQYISLTQGNQKTKEQLEYL